MTNIKSGIYRHQGCGNNQNDQQWQKNYQKWIDQLDTLHRHPPPPPLLTFNFYILIFMDNQTTKSWLVHQNQISIHSGVSIIINSYQITSSNPRNWSIGTFNIITLLLVTLKVTTFLSKMRSFHPHQKCKLNSLECHSHTIYNKSQFYLFYLTFFMFFPTPHCCKCIARLFAILTSPSKFTIKNNKILFRGLVLVEK